MSMAVSASLNAGLSQSQQAAAGLWNHINKCLFVSDNSWRHVGTILSSSLDYRAGTTARIDIMGEPTHLIVAPPAINSGFEACCLGIFHSKWPSRPKPVTIGHCVDSPLDHPAEHQPYSSRIIPSLLGVYVRVSVFTLFFTSRGRILRQWA